MTTEIDGDKLSSDGGLALVAAAFECLPAQVAVVDADGVTRKTNAAWERFARDSARQRDVDTVGENYLSACEDCDDGSASEAAAGIRSVLAGERSEFSCEYPCHSPAQRRWFLMRAIGLTVSDERHALVMHVDITERKEAELDVEANNETLSTVASVLSHDLRNPLNVAMARAAFLAEDPDVGARTVAEQVAAIRSSLDRMNVLVDDALVLARESETVDAERVDLGSVAREAWSHVETAGATLRTRDDVVVVADASLLAQAFENLFRNAVEHDDAGTVTVGPSSGGFYVADTGPGVARADRERVFEAGYTTDDATSNTGMGLAIVEKIAEAHGWTVRVTDEHAPPADASGGARFEFAGVTVDG